MHSINVLFFIFLSVIVSFAQTDKQEKLQATIDSIRTALDIPAISFTCILPSGERVSVASGTQPQMRMLAGSTGKTFFAALAMVYAQEEKFSLDDPIQLYLKSEAWLTQLPNYKTITIRMLLNHTSGVEEYYEIGDFLDKLRMQPNKVWSPQECIAYILNRKPLFEAGKDWSYADTNYLILGLILENVSKRNAYEEIDRLFIKPNHLTATEPSVHRVLNHFVNGKTSAALPFKLDGFMMKEDSLRINPQFEWAGGGFVSNPIDLAQWARELYQAEFLNTEFKNQMQRGVPAKTGRDHQYGLGLQIRPSPFGLSYGHGGWFPGYLTEMEFFPDKQMAASIQIATDDFAILKRPARFYELYLLEKLLRLYEN